MTSESSTTSACMNPPSDGRRCGEFRAGASVLEDTDDFLKLRRQTRQLSGRVLGALRAPGGELGGVCDRCDVLGDVRLADRGLGDVPRNLPRRRGLFFDGA